MQIACIISVIIQNYSLYDFIDNAALYKCDNIQGNYFIYFTTEVAMSCNNAQ